ncbi:amidase family protein [Venturia nashicola]|uniref:Amidase family protein n=1 Tax=Venturia nashicola TaxID=86259 RepID=A0A4Z1PBY0_9PEZI|nr:amidase family protein [Venturia nashicola]TLD29775.1 amidase family protein [Venturia nashicola]
MRFCSSMQRLFALATAILVHAGPLVRNDVQILTSTSSRNDIFSLGDITFLANLQYPKISLKSSNSSLTSQTGLIPSTVIHTNESSIDRQVLQSILARYRNLDDVYNDDFHEAIFLFSSARTAHLDKSAASFLTSLNLSHVVLSLSIARSDHRLPGSVSFTTAPTIASLPPGPYVATISSAVFSLSSVYRLYPDTYRDFLFGSYDSGDGQGTYKALGTFLPKFWDPMIPVPSRVYSLYDTRALAGERVAIKDLFDIKGLQTSGGSQAWATITPTANETAPSIQKIVDLGGVLVGKYKLAQFASGANPWDWQDEQYPFNPRGDGWLTCSASSSGGGCSIAAYDWLDFAIGSDTGSSMRRPAAVSGTYGQRPSQGMITLDRVIPLGGATDTAGVFSRNPYKWVKFSKAWYDPALHQDSSVTGLSKLIVPDSKAFPKTIIYPTDYLPLNNSAAEVILQGFIQDLSKVFNMTLKKVNFTQTIINANASGALPFDQANDATIFINTYTQWTVVGKPLITTWRSLFSNRFPPIDPARREDFRELEKDDLNYRASAYAAALVKRREAVEWYESKFQYSTTESCSESVMLYDVGTGGKPSFREKVLNDSPAASYLAVIPKGTLITGANICPIFGCADFTVPIGQVPYFSNVTFRTEMVPVTVNMVVRRGCDFMLYNMIEKLAERGVLKTVKTGSTAF